MGKKTFWQSLRKKKWLASTGMLAAGALAVYGVWQIPSLNQYHMETLETPLEEEDSSQETEESDSGAEEKNSLELPREEETETESKTKSTKNKTSVKTEKTKTDKAQKKQEMQTAQAETADETKQEEEDSVTVLSNPQSAMEEENFDESAGLSWPIEGDVILNYDTDGVVYFSTLAQYKANPAIMIAGSVGSKVKASADGVVEEITKNEETGVTVKTNVGNSYEIIYGQLENLKVSEGDTIKEGAVIGTLAEPTDYFTLEGANLYFQILQEDTPVNPLLLLK
jgi:murein DD-endopeptidase MepM/ murein hydrolase activator NlpD